MKSTKTAYPGISRLPDGRHLIRLKVPDPVTRRMKDLKKITESRSASAAAYEREVLKQEIISGSFEKPEPILLREFAKTWMMYKRSEIAPSTARRYVEALELHILPHLGQHPISALSRTHIMRWRDQAPELSPVTRNGHLRVLKTLLADACAEMGLPLDPAHRVKALPVGPQGEGNCLTAEELPQVLIAINKASPDWHALFCTLAMTGARFGEATALRWEDISPEFITIRRAQWRGTVGRTKTGKTRVVPLLPELARVLLEHRKALLASQAPGFDGGYIFPSKNGTLLHGPSARKPLGRALEEAGITRRFTIHGFRRTYNNLLRQEATGEVVRSMTGHSSETMTEHYSHIALFEKKVALDRAIGHLFQLDTATK